MHHVFTILKNPLRIFTKNIEKETIHTITETKPFETFRMTFCDC